ncbi:uracil-DNA glycosylase [Listeria newyorkensis]|uniref:Uracil-DNA glycosylase n=1 Tax=Listeria newyorkensis TaxID=1497681 RepID=A0ABX4XIQ7_9LIST|nr:MULTISPECIES: uracil-DNA glycosylase [Listeria]KGL45008.1 uracil-DNA glycosylase [Listeriaceae bacterium FSL A5-0209]KGL40866.1 uracil-DNA glycosylase [Listeria newyorkensis]KMT62622.1 uracil-DNA glycosylase [Listeria newyorkensis]PNP87093.1 uracil-DNA glycosylase [Listeria newyorkensis]RQW68289.1 uracil-DNA glycosylase [Listeria sp. SHR_NRA_18]
MIQLGNDWDALLQEEFMKDYYLKLRAFLKVEYGNQKVYPDMYDIFNALKYTAYQDVKVVILGQDPYHGAGQAHGMSFSVKLGVKTPPSLVNMYKELADDLGLVIPNNGYLLPWAEQGVLLLNTVLTVREGKPNSHANQGWEKLTDTIISLLGQKTEPVVFLLWGNNAKSKQPLLRNPNHLILTSVHPSPLSANRGFMGCRHFSKANHYLTQSGVAPINWQIPNI